MAGNPEGFEVLFPTYNVSIMEQDIGDLFRHDIAYLGIGTIYRSWHTNVYDASLGRREVPTKISVRYNIMKNEGFLVIVNGKVRFRFQANITSISSQMASFKYYSHQFDINVRRILAEHEILLVMDGKPLKEFRETPDVSLGEARPISITIDDMRVAHVTGPAGTKKTAYFQISTQIENADRIVKVEKRFSEFEVLDDIIRGYIVGHMRSSLPSLPPKVLNPFFDQLSGNFLLTRKFALQQYLIDLKNNSKVSSIQLF